MHSEAWGEPRDPREHRGGHRGRGRDARRAMAVGRSPGLSSGCAAGRSGRPGSAAAGRESGAVTCGPRSSTCWPRGSRGTAVVGIGSAVFRRSPPQNRACRSSRHTAQAARVGGQVRAVCCSVPSRSPSGWRRAQWACTRRCFVRPVLVSVMEWRVIALPMAAYQVSHWPGESGARSANSSSSRHSGHSPCWSRRALCQVGAICGGFWLDRGSPQNWARRIIGEVPAGAGACRTIFVQAYLCR